MKRRFPLHVHISTLFLTLILIVGGVIGGLGYRISHNILETTASDLSTRISRETLSEKRRALAERRMVMSRGSSPSITRCICPPFYPMMAPFRGAARAFRAGLQKPLTVPRTCVSWLRL